MIIDPYKTVAGLLGDENNHYKTNLHTHSTVSDASEDYSVMIKAHYDRDYDILGFADHGVLGRYWNEEPAHLPLYRYQKLLGKSVNRLGDNEYERILSGEYSSLSRTKKRGMQCVPGGIELNMLTLTKSHVNGYFCRFGENDPGHENGFEYAVKGVDKAGGLSVINHPGDWLGSAKDHNIARDPKNARFFGNIFNEYRSCLGMEILNEGDTCTQADRILWDSVLRYVLPRGERNVWGFANSDAHDIAHIDTSFMDFILPEYSLENVKTCMENGAFFAVGRRARPELGDDFAGKGDYPAVTALQVNEKKEKITVTGKNADRIQWIADGKVIAESTEKDKDGAITSRLDVHEHIHEIGCYVRFQLSGAGGICMSQPFIIDNGQLPELLTQDSRSDLRKAADRTVFGIKSLRVFVIAQEIARAIKK